MNHGFHRDVWKMKDPHGGNIAFKNQQFEHYFTPWNFDRHRRDALEMERLTKSPHVVDIFGFCACAGVPEYSKGGDIIEAVWPSTKSTKKRGLARKGGLKMHRWHKESLICMILKVDLYCTHRYHIESVYSGGWVI